MFLPASAQSSTQELIIQPKRGWIAIDWAEMYRYRELLAFLVWRDVKVRYKQSILGVAWAVIVPVMNMLIFTVIFHMILNIGKDMKSDSGALIPYAIFVYTALLPWQLFANAVSGGGMSLVNQQHLLTKIYFPRLFLPTAAVGALLVDMAISFGVLVSLMIIYHFVPTYQFMPTWRLLTLPFLVIITLITSLGMAYALSAITVTYRDFRFLVPFMNQILMYVSFVGYPLEQRLADKHPALVWLGSLNPMFGIVDSFRAAVMNTPFHPGYLLVSFLVSSVLLVFGMFYFRRTERRFADIA